jgi:acetyltransferase-like isoleucine patch superfamily enzyme
MSTWSNVRIHPTAEVSFLAAIGEGTSIWNHCQVREGVVIGRSCILSKDVYVDAGVQIGDNVKIQNGVSVYHGVTIEDGVFVGPHVCFTNDKRPRAINADGTLKGSSDWVVSETRIEYGAALGAGAVILSGIRVGRWAMVAAGAVVTHDVPAYGLAVGHPARLRGFVCPCGVRVECASELSRVVRVRCPKCGFEVDIALSDWRLLAE